MDTKWSRRLFRIVAVVLLLMLVWSQVQLVQGQESSDEPLALRFRRNFGYSLGAQMQGTFTIRAEGPPELARVEFLLDGEVIGVDEEAPFRLGLNTRDYPEGIHRFSAVGYFASGEELQSATVTRQFVATSAVTIIVIAVVVLVLAFRGASYYLARRSGSKGAAYGFLGGAVCPNCGRAFSIHWWSLRLGVGRYDRCSHCGKWNVVNRVSTERLLAAETNLGQPDGSQKEADSEREEEARRRRIEESRYDAGSKR